VAALFLWVAGFRGRDFVRRVAITAVAAIALLLPWGVHNARQEGAFTLADSHGGITALMGGNPNSEGTYSRALHEMWKEVMGRSFLSPPHQETDHLAWGVAKRWWRASPLWTLGMIPLRAERLFGWEHGLLYWSMYRPGVLPERDVLAAERWRAPLTAATDGYWLLLTVAFLVGCRGVFVPGRAPLARAGLVLLIAAGLTSTATYLLLVAEPRYRLGIEALMLPVAALGWVSSWSSLTRWVKTRQSAREVIPSLALVGGVALLALLAPSCGERLRARGRWAVTVAHVDGRACFLYVLPAGGPSMVRGVADEIELVGSPDRPGTARVQLDCPRIPGTPEAPRRPGPATLSFEVVARARGQDEANGVAAPWSQSLRLQGREPQTAESANQGIRLAYALTPEETEGPWAVTFAPQADVTLHLRRATVRSQGDVHAPSAASSETTKRP
jgi:hypothetical protein